MLLGQCYAETSTFSFKKDGKTVAKLEGSFSFQILQNNVHMYIKFLSYFPKPIKSLNSQETVTINLSESNIETTGSQSDKETVFHLRPIKIEGDKLKFEGATMTFSKSEKSAVTLESVQLNYSSVADDNKSRLVFIFKFSNLCN